MHFRGLVLFRLLLPSTARRSIRIGDFYDDAQQQANTLNTALKGSAKEWGELLPRGFFPALRRPGHLGPRLAVPPLRVGPHDVRLAFNDASDPKEDDRPPSKYGGERPVEPRGELYAAWSTLASPTDEELQNINRADSLAGVPVDQPTIGDDDATASRTTDGCVRNPRKVEKIEKYTRLPVWPAASGLAYIILDFLGLTELAAKAEDKFGGRVCPMFFGSNIGDPFILMVHHRHSWNRLDPFRPLFRSLILPEGFPAHQHRGFETITYVLPGMGGLRHRDSMGLKMEYGDGECQWMTAGSGMLHEEMWSNDLTNPSAEGLNFDSELYQIWLNLPSRHKMTKPRVQLLRPSQQTSKYVTTSPEEVPVIDLPTVSPTPGVIVRVLAGKVGNTCSKVQTFSDVMVLHTTIAPGSTWDLPLPPEFTAMLYVRKGDSLVSVETPISVHKLAFFERSDEVNIDDGAHFPPDGVRLTNDAVDASDVADVLLLAGRPLREPVASAGPFVMNTEAELRQAFIDFSTGPLSEPWDHTVSDEEWRAQVARNQEAA